MENDNTVTDTDSSGTEKTVNQEVVTDGSEEISIDTLKAQKKHWRDKHEALEKEFETYKSQNPVKESKATAKKSSGELDYGQKAYLNAEGIDPQDFDFVQEEMKQSGLDKIENLLENGYFQGRLKQRVDDRAVADASTSNSRSTGDQPQTKVDYYINKGELPPNTPENRKLREEVVNRRIEIQRGKSHFADRSVIDDTTA